MLSRWHRRARGSRGAALVEFAMLLPFLALLVCGVIDIGRFYSASNEARNAAREGALFAQSFPNQQKPFSGGACAAPNNVEARVRQELGVPAVSGAFTITSVPTVSSCNPPSGGILPGTEVTVHVSRQMSLITPLIRNMLGSPTVSAKVTAVVQG